MVSRIAERLLEFLTPTERLAAVVSASARGDGAEHRRLLCSAPKVYTEISHHYPLATRLEKLVLLHAIVQLDLLVRFYRAAGAEQTEGLAQIAQGFYANESAFHAVCAELQIDSDHALEIVPLPALETLRQAGGIMDALAAANAGGEEVEETADAMRKVLDPT